MKYRTGSVAAAIQRQTKYIEAELKAGKSQATIRQEMMAAKQISETSQAHFNQVLRDLRLNKSKANSPSVTSSVPSPSKSMDTTVIAANGTGDDAEVTSAVAVRARQFTSPLADPRFSTRFKGEGA
ncbi:hypothetical protein [Qipengyuania sp.]|uniref:hypothetical protein n=1 Tax=Qipengyuania sp. TaxID=2004515 RepID=UPI003735A8DF